MSEHKKDDQKKFAPRPVRGQTDGRTGGKPSGRPAGRPGGKPFARTDSRTDNRTDRREGGRRPQGGRPVRPAPRRAAPPTDGLPARRLALRVIREVTEEGAYTSLSLDRALRGCGLSFQDRRLAARLAMDTLDSLLTLDWALNQFMARPDTDIKLRNVLRLGACQILLEDRIPESAATDTSVSLCKELGMEGLAGVCNGILRSLVRGKDGIRWPDPAEDPAQALSVRASAPKWLVERLTADWGAEEAAAILNCRAHESAVTIRRSLTATDEAGFDKLLEGKVWQAEPGHLPDSRRIRGMADIGEDRDFLAGRFSIQSESSMLACLAVAPKRGWQVLDMCAAPGGKSCYLAELMDGTGRVWAWELHEHRTALIAAQVKRLRLDNVRPVTRDASKVKEDLLATMDAVLLDAPCSGTGDMAEKPDIKYRLKPENVAQLTELQRALLDAAAGYVKPGGTLVYSTCSLLKDENERQIAAFLERHPEYTLQPLPASIPEALRTREGTGLQLMPQREGMGGFYICRMRRAL